VRDFTAIVSSLTTTQRAFSSPLAVWQVFPNPSTGTISLTGAVQASVLEVWDSTGRLLRTQTLQRGAYDTHTADLHDLPKGLYVLRLRGMAGAQRLVLQ
jgi:hypothetical protein